MRGALGVLGVLLLASPGRAEVMVRVSGSEVDLTATAAPLADVLDRLARQTGMKVVYEGPAPRQLVTLSLHARSAAETVLAVLEGQGLNFAMVADTTGRGVSTLVVAGAAGQSSAPAASGAAANDPRSRRRLSPPPAASPDSGLEEDQEEPGDPAFQELPGVEAVDPTALPPNAASPSPPEGTTPPPGPGFVPPLPQQSFPVSPFAPQPQPFPQAPPAMPTVPGGPPPDESSAPASVPPP